MKFKILSWSDIIRLTLNICHQIRTSNFKPTTIIAILRGGLVPARIISDCLDINRFYVLGVSFYTDIATHSGRPVITQPLNVNLEGTYALLVDDVVDTGESIVIAKEHIMNLGARDVKVVTLHKKPWAKFLPDYYIEETDSWIVYPWEYYETIQRLEKKISDPNISDEDRKTMVSAMDEIKKILNKYMG